MAPSTVKSQTEVELKLLVPTGARAMVAAEMARGATTPQRTSLAAIYLDTADRRLARRGMAWRVRREGRQWVQALKGPGASALERFEHEVPRPDASHDPQAHAGTVLGDRLILLLDAASAEGVDVGPRYRTEVRRTIRRVRVRVRGAVVEVAFDEGRMLAGESVLRIREVEFELISGSIAAMLALAERWRQRFGLIYDPRSKSERGDRLADGSQFPALRKAARPAYKGKTTAHDAFAAVFDECLAQITLNAIGGIEGEPALQPEHVHQVRVGIRRLRSAWRCFQGWVAAPAPDLTDSLRSCFGSLGLARDSDVLTSGIMAELAQVGAPPLTMPSFDATPDAAELMRRSGTQAMLLALIAWRAALATEAERTATSASGHTESDRPVNWRRRARRRLRHWHRQIAADAARFDTLDEPRLHALRKRVKRQRYAIEFFAPILRRRPAEQYLKVLAKVQDRMGKLNDLFAARAHYQPLVDTGA